MHEPDSQKRHRKKSENTIPQFVCADKSKDCKTENDQVPIFLLEFHYSYCTQITVSKRAYDKLTLKSQFSRVWTISFFVSRFPAYLTRHRWQGRVVSVLVIVPQGHKGSVYEAVKQGKDFTFHPFFGSILRECNAWLFSFGPA